MPPGTVHVVRSCSLAKLGAMLMLQPLGNARNTFCGCTITYGICASEL
jgi:hypothetical protein